MLAFYTMIDACARRIGISTGWPAYGYETVPVVFVCHYAAVLVVAIPCT